MMFSIMHFEVAAFLSCIAVFSPRMVVKSESLEVNRNIIYSMNGIILEFRNLPQINNSVGEYIQDPTSVLLLRNCRRIHLDRRTFQGSNYHKIKTLHIIGTKIFEVEPNGFEALPNLVNLQISVDHWREIKDYVFMGLGKLEVLNLRHNHLEILNGRGFSGLRSLQALDLSNNDLKSLPGNIFQDLTQLENLDLSRNSITKLEPNTFSGLRELINLNLAYNSLNSVDAESFRPLRSLQNLNLNSNSISIISGTFQLYNLKFLDLAENRLRSIPVSLLRNCEYLMSLDLSKNNLVDLSEEPFIDLLNLKHLTLSGNSISIRRFDNLVKRTLISYN